MADAIKNFAYSTIAVAPSPELSGTTATVATGDGTKFAVGNATVWPPSVEPTVANAEIVRISLVSTDTLTFARTQEGSTNQSIATGWQIQQGVTAALLAQYAALSGATFSGAVAMGANKITGLANGTASTDAAAFGQIPTALPPNGTAGGDLTGTYPNPTLKATGTPGTYGDSLHYPIVTTDAEGRVTAVTTDALPTALPPNGSAGGDLTGTYPNPTLIATGTAGTYGAAATVPVITTDSKGRVTAVTDTSIAIAESQVTSLTTDLSAKMATSTYDPAGLAQQLQASAFLNMAGKNAIINGGMDIWQRGTSFTSVNYPSYTADRWQPNSLAGSALNVSQVAAGLNGFQYALRAQRPNGDTAVNGRFISQSIESANSIPFAGQIVTLSFYARAGANFSGTSLIVEFDSGTGTDQNVLGGFTGQTTIASISPLPTTSWARYTLTATVPSTATQLGLLIHYTPTGTAGTADYFDITGVQLELGSLATPFSRAGGSIGGELALCQRYFIRYGTGTAYEPFGVTIVNNATTLWLPVIFNYPMRSAPTLTASAASTFNVGGGTTPTAVGNYSHYSNQFMYVTFTVGSATTGQSFAAQDAGLGTAYLFFSAEL